jgi:hypothetical protein
MSFSFGRVFGTAAILMASSMVQAQESTNRVTTISDWNVFTEAEPKECWGVSKPTETVNTRDGAPVSVRRDDILLFVTFRPGKAAEVSFTGGYTFAGGSTVEVAVDNQTFQLFTEGEWAWTGSPEDDLKLMTALKAGSTAVLKAQSGRGTLTTDTFSLRGFTAAMEDAEKRCQ